MGDHLICTLQLAELEGKLSFYFDILFFMAELQEVWDSAGRVSNFQLCPIIKGMGGRFAISREGE